MAKSNNKPNRPLDNRANTPEQKKEIIDRLLVVWLSVPDLRLGQLIANVVGTGNLFYKEDYNLMVQVEDYLKQLYAPKNE